MRAWDCEVAFWRVVVGMWVSGVVSLRESGSFALDQFGPLLMYSKQA